MLVFLYSKRPRKISPLRIHLHNIFLCVSFVPNIVPKLSMSSTCRKEQFGKSTKATNKYYKNKSKDDLVLRATLESITRFG